MPADAFNISYEQQNNSANPARCHYHIKSSDVRQCQDISSYKCPHCSIMFCLQHGMQHQKDLKEKIRHQLVEAKVRVCQVINENHG